MSLMVTASGEKHGLINSVGNSVKAEDRFKNITEKNKEKAEKQRKEDCRMVKARYINHRGNHERLSKPYCRYAGDPIQTWHFIPEQEYEVPKGLVDEVNDPNKRLARRSEILDSSGKPTLKDGPGERIHEFVPISF